MEGHWSVLAAVVFCQRCSITCFGAVISTGASRSQLHTLSHTIVNHHHATLFGTWIACGLERFLRLLIELSILSLASRKVRRVSILGTQKNFSTPSASGLTLGPLVLYATSTIKLSFKSALVIDAVYWLRRTIAKADELIL